MKNLYFNSIVNKFKYLVVLLVILFGVSNTANAQIKKAFTQRTSPLYVPERKIYNVKGDFTMLGNTCLTPQNYTATTNNNNQSMIYVDTDTDSNTFNSSSSTLDIPVENGSTPSCSNIVFAGLYWTGKGSASATFNVTKSGVTKTFNKRIVKLKGPTASSYTDVTAATTDIYYPSGSEDDIYSAYAEITTYVRANGLGKYTVADMALLEGGSTNGTGFSGGWGMIVIYENSKMKWRDVTIFDGYAYVEASNSSAGIELPVSGFNTVQTGNVGMKIGVMASEGDVGFTGDYFKIRNLNTNTYTALSHSGNSATNFFNSSINSGGTRSPNLVNNTGIDIATITIPNTNNTIIGNSQTSTKFLYGTNGDTYSIFTIAMSVDAYVPEVEGTLAATAINNVPVTSQPYTSQPGQDIDFNVDIKNLGTEAVNNFKVTVPIPYNATYVPGSAIGTVLFTPLPTPNSITFNPSLGATGSIVWDFGTLPLPANASTILAKLKFKLKATTDCSILVNTSCGNALQAVGFTGGVGAITGISLVNKPFIEGYSQNGNCIGEPIPQPVDITIDGLNYVNQNCANTPTIRAFSYCSASTTVAPSEIASFFPAGSLFYNQFPVTTNAIQYTTANPIPLVSGSTVTYYAVPPNASSGCNFQFTISKCPAIIAQNDALTGGNGTAGNPNAGNVLNNNGSGADTLNGVQATISQVNITVTTPATPIGGAPVPVIDTATGQVSVPAGTPAGTYTIVYNLCEKLNPTTNCDPATVTITVTAPAIVAQNDTIAGGNGTAGNPNAGNVLNNNGNGADTLNGNPASIAQVNISVTTPAVSIGGAPVPTLDVSTGQISVPAGTPAGTYTIVYNLCEKLNPTNCDPATVTITCTAPAIIAQDDTLSGGNGTTGNPNAGNVLNNNGNGPDTLNGNPVTISQVNVTVTTPATPINGGSVPVLTTTTGQVSVPAGTPAGTYTIVYNLCEKLNPTNCDPATVTITVTPPAIIAQDDTLSGGNGTTGNPNAGNVLNNNGNGPDTLNGNPVTISQVNVTVTTPATPINGGPVPVLATTTGQVSIPAGTPAGTYTIVYNLCEKLNPTNCDPATVTITVTPPAIIANDDAGAPVNGLTGGVGYTNVLVNDTLNGQPVLASQVTTTFVSSTNAGITLSGTDVIVAPGTPAGSYTLTYQICEILNPTNCDTAVVTVTCTPAQIIANDDAGAPVNGLTGGVGYTNVLVNDTLNGQPVLASQVTTTFVSSTNAGITLSGTDVIVAPGTPAGSYTLTYQICEILNPTNCDTAIVTVAVSAAQIIAIDDAGAPVNGLTGGVGYTNVLVNDTLNGQPVLASQVTTTFVSSTNAGITLSGTDVIVAPGTPAGSYTLTYQICEILNPTNCDTAIVTVAVSAAQIIANDDAGAPVNGLTGGVGYTNVLVNDTLNGQPVLASQVNTTFVSSTNAGITLSGTDVIVAPGTPAGSYTLTYQICEILNPTNCDTAIVTVAVSAAQIIANDDAGAPVNGLTGGVGYTNVLVNDTINGQPVLASQVTTTFVSSTNAGITLSGTDVIVAPGTPAGSYTLTYQICEILNPTNCDTAIVTVAVSAAQIIANDDAGAPVNGLTGGVGYTNVLVNDTLNGQPVLASQVTTTFVSSTNAGITLSGTDVIVAPGTPAGSYTLTYQICEILNPTNCDTAIVTVTCTPAQIIANDDAGAPVNGLTGGVGYTNVLVNDTLNGQPVLASQVTTTFVSSTNAGITLSGTDVIVAPGTPAGSYTLTYQICEILNPTNCDTAVVTVTCTPAQIIANDDAGAPVNGLTGGVGYTNVLVNDTLNGQPVLASQVTTTFVSSTNAGITLSGTDVIVAPGTPGGSYTLVYQICEILNPGNCDNATVTVNVYTPSINLLKNGTYVDSLAPTGVSVGDTIVYNFTVINTGGADLTNVTVTDPLVTVVGGPIALLPVGATDSTTFTATYTITQADIDAGQVNNLATATGTPPSGPPVTHTSTDPTPCTTCDPVPNCPTCTITPLTPSPAIAITKDGTFNDLAPIGITNAGDTVTYNFVVTNTGNVTLHNITVTDNNAVVTGGPLASLAVGASDSTTFSAVHTITQADIDAGVVYNLATATGNPPSGPPVTGTSTDPTPCTTCPSNPPCTTCTGTPLINANDDTYSTVACNVSGVTGNILSNDTLGSLPVNSNALTQVTLTILTGSNPNITIANNGDINFTSGVAAGSYTFTYQICSTTTPNVCDQASVTINVVDTTPPVMTDASNLTVQCDGAGNNSALQAWLASHGGATASDTCSNVTWSNNFNGLSDGCGNTGAATVIFTATDDSGNASTTSATFTIEDTTAPTIDTAAANATVQCDGQGNTAALQAWLSSNGGATASDICSNVTWSNNYTELSNGCGNTGSATVTFTATDDCGNTITTSATFTIEDTTAPTIDTAAANATVQCDGQGNASALQAWLTSNGGATASDICSNVTWSNNFNGLSDGCGNTGSATVLFTATDDCGNASTSSATFTIEDTTAPTIDTAATNATVQCDGQGNAAAIQAWLTSNGGAAASDICSGTVTWTNNFTELSDGCGNTGTATVTFTATDACGNTATTSATFTIEDTTAPTIDAAATNATVQCDGQGNASDLQAWLSSNGGAVASDICSGTALTWTNNYTELSDGCGNTGAATVTFTAADACGNTATTSATFTIEDTTAPTIDSAAANATVQCDGQGNAAALQAWLISNGGAVASDICSGTAITWTNNYTELSDGCGNTGSATVTFTAADACGNTATTSATFTIEDTTAPSIDTAATNITVQCNGAGNTGALEAWLTSNGGAVASDVCSGTVTWSNNFASLSSDCSTAVTVIFTATDACGNASTTSATFTVEDTTAPTIDTAATNATVQCDGQGNAAALQAWLSSNGGAAASDTCTNVTWSNNFTELSDGCGNTGTATVTFTATDACGNTATTSATFTIEDTTAPTIDAAATNATVQCDGQGNASDLQSWLSSNGGATASDICSGTVTWTNNYTELSDGCGNTGAATVTFTAADACGNTVTTSATFTIEDTTAPTIDTAAANATVQCDGQGNTAALQAWLTSNGGAVASDICSGTAITWTNNYTELSDGCGNTGAATVTFTAADACGNTVTTSATFTIEDTTAPSIDTAATNITVQCNGAGNTGALEAWLTSNGGAVASDVCSGTVTWTNNFASLSSDCSTAVTVIFTATDACGNASTTSATFTVEDTTAPTIDTAATNATVQCDGQGNTAALQAWLTSNAGAAASDTCTNVTWSNNFTELSDGCGNTGAATVTFTATDACGNTATTSATFTIEDTTAPTIDTAAANATVQCDGNGNTEALQAWLSSNGGAAASDICSGTVTWTNNFTELSDGCGNTGSATVTFTAADACGNTATTSATFTIEDTTAPTIDTAAANATVQCDGQGNTAALQAWLTSNGGAVASDICSGTAITWSNNYTELSDGCGNTGAATVTFTAADACGNTATTSATFTIEDTTAPTIDTAAANVTAQCDGNGNTSDLQAWLSSNGGAAASDICSGTVTWTNNYTELSNGCGNTGSATVTFTAADACGNTATTSATFTIEDTTAPTIDTAATDATVQCDGQGNTAALQAWLTSNGGAVATDNCSSTVTWSNNFTALSDGCGSTGTATVTFTATDDCGNTSTSSATFTIEDTTAPTIDTPAANATAQCDGNGNTSDLQAWLSSNGGAVASDICSGTVTWSNNFDGLSDGCGNTGNVTVLFTATDACGNTATTSATFAIEDTTAPTIDTPAANATVQCDGLGNAAALQAWLTSNGGAAASDICSTGITWSNNFTALTAGCGNTGSATVTFTATDDCGNASTTTATFAVVDTTPPTIDTPAPASISYTCIGDVPPPTSLSATDNCAGSITVLGTDSTVQGSCANSFTVTRTWTFVDACGNTSTATQTISVSDTVAPTLNSAAPANTTASCDNIPAPAVLTATDNCGTATVAMTETILQGSCAANYSIIRTWIATDACGNNSLPVSQTIAVSDTTGPALVGDLPTKIEVTCDVIPAVPTLVFTDNCSAVGTPVFTETQSAPIDGVYNITRTWTVTDACGNSSTFTQFIIVTQTTQVITLPDFQTSNNLDVNISLGGLLPAGVTGGTWTNVNNVGGYDPINNTFNPLGIAPANYLFSYTISNGGCLVRYDVTIVVGFVADCQNIVIHNAFTPNGDNINEWFQIDHIGDFDCYPTNKVEIYNRWGVLVYETNNYDNSSKRFEGVSEGRATVSKSDELPTGTYFYIIQWTTTEGKTENRDGYLYLTR